LTGLIVAGAVAIAAAPGVINQYNALCSADFPTRCAAIAADGSLSVSGGGGGASGLKATAADPTYAEGSTGNPLSGDLSGYQRVLIKNFVPIASGTLAVSSAPGSRLAFPTTDPTVILQNAGPQQIFYALGNAAINASTSSYSLPAGSQIAVSISASQTHVAAITATGTSTLTIVQGRGTPVMGSSGGSSAASGIVSDMIDGEPLTGGAQKTYSMTAVTDGFAMNKVKQAATALNSNGVGLPPAQIVGQCVYVSVPATSENFWGNIRIGCADHTLLVGGAGGAGVPAGGVVSVQGVSGGQAIPITGNVGQGSPPWVVRGNDTAIDGSTQSNILRTFAQMGVYSGVGIDLVKETANGLNSTGGGLMPAQQVGQCDDTSPTAITENSFGNARINCTTHAQLVEALPSASAASGIVLVRNAALNSALIIKAAAGNLYGVEVTTTGAAGYMLLLNATAVPGAGAVVPEAHCYVPAFGTCGLNFNPPAFLSTGAVVVFTTATTPFTYTPSTTVSFSGQMQ